jgi:hypothetical protein
VYYNDTLVELDGTQVVSVSDIIDFEFNSTDLEKDYYALQYRERKRVKPKITHYTGIHLHYKVKRMVILTTTFLRIYGCFRAVLFRTWTPKILLTPIIV